MSRAFKVVNLEPPYEEVMLWLRLDHDDWWRFHSWEVPAGMSIPAEPPPTTLSIGFYRPWQAARFFTQVLTNPAEAVPPASPVAPGKMEPSPAVDYYWPPTLADAIVHHQNDAQARSDDQIPVERVFILGAGFSAAFGYTTARDIVKGTLKWAEGYHQDPRRQAGPFARRVLKWTEDQFGVPWFIQRYRLVAEYLGHRFPTWQNDGPSLYGFLDTFFRYGDRQAEAAFARSSDPLGLAELGVSWENDNYETWFEKLQPFPEDERSVLPAFEGLLAMYLLTGLKEGDVLPQWARSFARGLRPSDVILTFNWDVIIEVLMISEGTEFCRYDWTPSRVKLVKLHGSADLLGAPNRLMRADLAYNPERFECVTRYLWRARTREPVLPRTKPAPFGRAVWPAERYNKGAVLIMPPRYPIGYGFELVQFNWKKAKTSLERAKEIYVIGYSLPTADLAFRDLIAKMAWSERTTIDVWDPDSAVGDRARSMFGDRVTFHQERASRFHPQKKVSP